jgi:hypothetical protein
MISIIIISIISILGWTNLFKQTFSIEEGFQYKYNVLTSVLSKIDFKPINCAYCLSFWVSCTLSIAFLDLSYMTIYLFMLHLKRD